MPYWWINIFIFIAGYFIGSINLSIIMSKKLKKEDIRSQGSNNAGSTNALRVYGKKFALVVFCFDVLKAMLPCFFVVILQRWVIRDLSISISLIPLIAGLGALVGHVWPIYFKFKGGKGAACFLGMVIATNIILLFIGIVLFLSVVLITKYVSLGSIVVPFILVLFAFIPWIASGPLGVCSINKDWFYIPGIVLLVADLIVIFMHRTNIKRLVNKTENKLRLKK
ncbi:glycerol-3-phosphate 1-O-acyltransferase PlsY [Mycoplasma sp. 128]|uniref:glycerol-3-phosphate 1-O-acyltransferase PlsY n=1 Tax=Mycoplasma sp. 3341 TaxID=3447506 RepID=UPI003F65D311